MAKFKWLDAKIKKSTSPKPKRISEAEFNARHGIDLSAWNQGATSVMEALRRPPPSHPAFTVPIADSELKRWWLFQSLAAAAEENCPDAFSSMLQWWFYHLDIQPPKGVFAKPKGFAGAPQKTEENKNTYMTWMYLEKPSLSDLARVIEGQKYMKASVAEQKRMRDKHWMRLKRYLKSSTTESPST